MATVGSSLPPEQVLHRYREEMSEALRHTLNAARASVIDAPATSELLDTFHGLLEYHLGWRHPDLSPATAHPGKLLRPTLVLLAAELAAGRAGADAGERAAIARRALPAGVCVELVHNFSLIHDDIEDGDEERRYRPTLWKLWGVPQAINAGDGLFAIARSSLWELVERGVSAQVVVRLAALVDRTCLELCEGQFLDMRFEGRQDVSVEKYLDMIGRKTASLMACSTEMGASIGAPADEALAVRMARFGRALGLAFQLRDDLLGIWAAEDLGKSAAGDLRRKKMSLPVIHALATADADDTQQLSELYSQPGAMSEGQIAEALAVLERTGARVRTLEALAAQVAIARTALDEAAGGTENTREAHGLLGALLGFVAEAAS